jgi:hypothetical protein
MKPVLSEAQLATIATAARPLHKRDRADFVDAVAARLRDVEIGDGVVGRIVRETQRAFLRPPKVEADDYAPRNARSA